MNAPRSRMLLPDIQSMSPEVPLVITTVGVRGLRLRLHVPDGQKRLQDTISECSLGARLSASQRGTHMSRFVEILDSWNARLDSESLRELLEHLCIRLESPYSMALFKFPFCIRKASPSGAESDMFYESSLQGELDNGLMAIRLVLEIPVMTVCPCSMAICANGAHSQRAIVRLRLMSQAIPCLPHLVTLAESASSSAVFTLLKREDEKAVTEQAFARPAFVEDVARKTAWLLKKERNIKSFEVEVESMESIHNHNAFALIRGTGGGGGPENF